MLWLRRRRGRCNGLDRFGFWETGGNLWGIVMGGFKIERDCLDRYVVDREMLFLLRQAVEVLYAV